MPNDPIASFFDSLRPCRESQMLAEFIHPNPGDRVLDVGCGTGYLALFIGWKYSYCSEIAGIDIFPSLIEQANRNREELYNLIGKNSTPIHFSVFDANTPLVLGNGFNVLICNPPFFTSGDSRPAESPNRRAARQDREMTLQGLFECAALQLRSSGRMGIVIPLQRIEEAKRFAGKVDLEIIRMEKHVSIRKRSGGICLIEFVKREPS